MTDLKKIEIVLEIINITEEIVNRDNLDDEQVAYFRNDLRKKTSFLQEELLENYSITICKYIIFPILAYVDEKMMVSMTINKSNSGVKWDLLHLESYDRKDGGEYVFDILDTIISDNIFPKICYQTIALILDNGFHGKFFDNPYDHSFLNYKKLLNKYLNKLTDSSYSLIDSSSSKNIFSKKRNKHLRCLIKLGIPTTLFVISLLIFLV